MKIREPINSITHLVGMVLSIIGGILLFISSVINFSLANILSSLVFSFGLVGLYTASTVYHWSTGGEDKLEKLRRIDHMMIYVLIASTYTPICLITLKGILGYSLLILIWSLAILGIILKAFWMNAPRWVSTGFYLLLGWISVFYLYPMIKVLPLMAIVLLFLGGVMYSVGAVIYGKKPDGLSIGKLGFHEIFHIFILLGSMCHFLMIFGYVIG